jgi:hypothetical protein
LQSSLSFEFKMILEDAPASLSRRKQGFESPRERQLFQLLIRKFQLAIGGISNFSPIGGAPSATSASGQPGKGALARIRLFAEAIAYVAATGFSGRRSCAAHRARNQWSLQQSHELPAP